jgi:hypothetical protein
MLLSWLMCAWSLFTMWQMSERRYQLAWWSSLLSQVGWGVVSVQASLWGMLAFSFVMAFVAARALYRLRGVS